MLLGYLTFLLLGALTSRASAQKRAIEDPSSYVLPFIGTTNGGHVFPGATLPHGMVKVGMDTDSPGNHAGYDADPQFNAIGFSQLHDDGTGGGVPLSNFKMWGFPSCPSFEECKTSQWARKVRRKVLPDGTPDDFASPGYFSTNLTSDLRVELTSTNRAALHRYTFPSSAAVPRILTDIRNDGQGSGFDPEMTIDPQSGRVKVGATFSGSFGPGTYKAFACADYKGEGFDLGQPVEWGRWEGDTPHLNTTTIEEDYYFELGSLLGFKKNPTGEPTKILVRVGISLISANQACANAEREIPDFDFERVHKDNREAWNDLLGRVQVDTTGVPTETVQLFYSSLYRSHISPADYTGENPKWDSTEPYYDSLYCNWDTYRTLYPLMSLHDPENFARIVRGMIDIQKHEGWLPECRGATVIQSIQGGSDADPILGEFWVKFHDQASKLQVSGNDLYTALLADAENEPPDWQYQGRQVGLWKKFNYIPHDDVDLGFGQLNKRHVSRTLEHAFNDFTIAQVAKIQGKIEDTAKYFNRSSNFLNVWNSATTVPGAPGSVKGMMQPRWSNGTFAFTDPRHCSIHDPTHATCFLDPSNHDGFYEGSPIIYSQYVPHDTARLIDLHGGENAFVERLNFIFDQDYFEPTNEPSQQMPFMYHYVNKPGLSTQRARLVLEKSFSTKVDGLPGNDDSGAMASYAAFYLAGLYPLPATNQFLLSSPYFPSISFTNPLFKTTTTIKSTPFGNGNVYVQSVKVNGETYKSNCYLGWDVFKSGGTVELSLTSDINVSCGTGPDALPPSLSTGGYN